MSGNVTSETYQILLILLISMTSIGYVKSENWQNASAELTQLLRNYDKEVRPFANIKPANVTVQISLLDIGPINEKDLTFNINIFMRQWWNDPRILFSSGYISFNGNPNHKLWLPDLFIKNSRSVKMHATTTETIRTTIQHNGDIYMSARLSAVCNCGMDLHRYPMDNQTCNVVFESYAYSRRELQVSWHSTALEYDKNNLQIEGYALKTIYTENGSVKYVTGEEFQHIIMKFDVERTFLYYLFRTYFPSSFLVIITWGSFFVPPTSYPARCGLIVTNFLASTFILQGASTQFTKVPYTTAIEIFLLVNISFIAFVMLEYLLVIKLPANFLTGRLKCIKTSVTQMKKANTGKITIPVGRERKLSEEMHDLDKFSMFLFPLSYIIFLTSYFFYYLIN